MLRMFFSKRAEVGSILLMILFVRSAMEFWANLLG